MRNVATKARQDDRDVSEGQGRFRNAASITAACGRRRREDRRFDRLAGRHRLSRQALSYLSDLSKDTGWPARAVQLGRRRGNRDIGGGSQGKSRIRGQRGELAFSSGIRSAAKPDATAGPL